MENILVQVKSLHKEILAVTFNRKLPTNMKKRTGTLRIKSNSGVSCLSNNKTKTWQDNPKNTEIFIREKEN